MEASIWHSRLSFFLIYPQPDDLGCVILFKQNPHYAQN